MGYLVLPFLAVGAIGLLCLNVKAGFAVSDLTEGSGFACGFYMMTVFGLTASEISLVAFLFQAFKP